MLYLKLGTVSSRKTANMLMTIHEYQSTGKQTLVLKPSRDTRNVGFITTRAGLDSQRCDVFKDEKELHKYLFGLQPGITVFIDEVQFCSIEECEVIKQGSRYHNILCYGLLADYKLLTFPAIANLMAIDPSIERIKSMCTFCEKAARANLRTIDGTPLYHGDSIAPEKEIGKDEYYKVCLECYYNPPTELVDVGNGNYRRKIKKPSPVDTK